MLRIGFGELGDESQRAGDVTLLHHLLRRRQHDARRMIVLHPPGKGVEQGHRLVRLAGLGVQDAANLTVQRIASLGGDLGEKGSGLVALPRGCQDRRQLQLGGVCRLDFATAARQALGPDPFAGPLRDLGGLFQLARIGRRRDGCIHVDAIEHQAGELTLRGSADDRRQRPGFSSGRRHALTASCIAFSSPK